MKDVQKSHSPLDDGGLDKSSSLCKMGGGRWALNDKSSSLLKMDGGGLALNDRRSSLH